MLRRHQCSNRSNHVGQLYGAQRKNLTQEGNAALKQMKLRMPARAGKLHRAEHNAQIEEIKSDPTNNVQTEGSMRDISTMS